MLCDLLCMASLAALHKRIQLHDARMQAMKALAKGMLAMNEKKHA